MWIEIKNKRNVAAALQKAMQRDAVTLEILGEEHQKKKGKNKDKNKDKVKAKHTPIPWRKRIHLICWIVLLVCIVCMIFMGILNAVQIQDNKYLNSLQDTRLVPYETGIYEVRKITALYNIHDTESYTYARTHMNLSDDLRNRLFPTEEYKGEDLPEATVELTDIRYEIAGTDYIRYLVSLTRRTEYGLKYFRAIVVLEGGKIVDWVNLE